MEPWLVEPLEERISETSLIVYGNSSWLGRTGTKALSAKFHCNPRRTASLLDTMSCAVQGIIPYGAQILIATGIAKGAGIELPSLALLSNLYYPWLLAATLLISIFMTKNKE